MTQHAGLIAMTFLAFTGGVPAFSPGQGSPPNGNRVRALVARGDTAAARALADTLADSAAPGSNERAEAVYWRGMLARSPGDGRVDLVRVAVEYPASPAAADALYRLAQIDFAAGDRESGRRLLGRAFAAYAGGATGGDAAFEYGQILLAEGSAQEGCAALDSGIARTPATQVEKRNRMSYARRPCDRLPTESPPDSQTTAPRRDTTVAAGGGTPPIAERGTSTRRAWSAQVGAFASKDDAEKTAAKLKARGYESRVTAEKPFRVRVGRFATRAEAAAVVAKLKAERTTAILVEAERP